MSNSICSVIERRLLSLNCPVQFRLGDTSQPISLDRAVTLVAWLEDRIIRAFPVNERESIRSPNDTWHSVFEAYLRTVHCPLLDLDPYSVDKLELYLLWLSSHAIGLQYEDQGEKYNKDAEDAASLPVDVVSNAWKAVLADHEKQASSSQTVQVSHAPDDKVPQDAQDAILALVNTLELTETAHRLQQTKLDARELVNAMQHCSRVIRQRVLTTVQANGEPKTATVSEGTSSDVENPQVFPSGIQSGDPILDKAITILRMLYISDLRELQDAANDILVTVQGFTADPRTDSKLGQVGK